MKKLIGIISIVLPVLVLIIITGCNNAGNGPGEPPYIPNAPSLPSPEKGGIICDITPLLNWEDYGDASEYQIQIDIDDNFTSPIIDVVTSEYQIPESLLPNGTYYWRVRAKIGEDSWSDWSYTWSFTIDETVTVPAIPIITNGQIIIDTTQLLGWEEMVSIADPEYNIQVSDNNQVDGAGGFIDDLGTVFETIEVEFSSADDEIIYYQIEETLENNTIYYWHVRVRELEGEWHDWSNTWFFIIHLEVPGNPDPASGSVITVGDPLLSWEDCESADEYRIQMSETDQQDEDGFFVDTIVNTTTIDPQYQIMTVLDHNQTYYWHVRLMNEDGVWGDWSDWMPDQDPFSFLVYFLQAPNVTGDAYTNTDQPTWTWNAVIGATKYRYGWTDGPPWLTETATETEFTPDSPLSEGPHKLYVQAGDDIGNWSEESGWFTITIDLTAPAQPTVTGDSPTNDTTPTWDWDDVGFRYRYGYTDGDWLTEVATVSYFTPTSSLGVGGHPLYVQARDEAGNWSTSGDFTITIETTGPSAPTISSSSHSDEEVWYSNNDPEFSWTEPYDPSGIDGYSYVMNQSASTVPDQTVDTTSQSHSYSDQPDGIWWFHVRAVDGAGNWGSTDHYTVRIDISAPGAPVISSSSHPNEVDYFSDNTPNMSWTAPSDTSGIDGYSYVMNQTASTVPDTTIDTTDTTYNSPSRSDGTWYFHVRAVDGAGSWGSTDHYTVRIDTSAPGIPVISSSSHPNEVDYFSDNTPNMSWTAPSDGSGSGIGGYSYVMNQTVSTVPDTTIDTTATTYDSPVRADGTWYFHVRAVDGAGNWGSTDHYTVRIDISAPGAPVISSSSHPNEVDYFSDNTPNMSWTAPSDTSGIDGYSYVMNQTASTVPDTTIDTTATTYDSPVRADGTWYFHVRAVDGAGNWGSTDHYTVRIDTLPPSSPDVSGDATTMDTTPTWSWDAVTDATGYRHSFTDGSGWTTTTALSYTPSALDFGTYTLYVQARDAAGNWSSSGSFTIKVYHKIHASDYMSYDYFGINGVVSGDASTVVVGAIGDDDRGDAAGSVYVFEWDSVNGYYGDYDGPPWQFQENKKILATDGAAGDSFGNRLAVSGDGSTIVVGATGDDDIANNAGSVYVYTRDGASWATTDIATHQTKITASDGSAGAFFGESVAVSGDGSTIVVGAYGEDVVGPPTLLDAGSVYVYERVGASWVETKITLTGAAAYDYFGSSVAITATGTRIVAGERGDDTNGNARGTAHVYNWNKGTQVATKLQQVYASSGFNYDTFGWTVAISSDGSTIAVGAPRWEGGAATVNGSVYVFELSGGYYGVYNGVTFQYNENKIIDSTDGADNDYFGFGLAITGDGSSIVVGAYGDDDNGDASGSVYVYEEDGTWAATDVAAHETKITASDGAAGDVFGRKVAVSGDGGTSAVGASQDDDNLLTDSGSVSVYISD